MKHRFTITYVCEVDVNECDYSPNSTPEERLATDLASIEDDPFAFMSNWGVWDIKGEIVND